MISGYLHCQYFGLRKTQNCLFSGSSIPKSFRQSETKILESRQKLLHTLVWTKHFWAKSHTFQSKDSIWLSSHCCRKVFPQYLQVWYNQLRILHIAMLYHKHFRNAIYFVKQDASCPRNQQIKQKWMFALPMQNSLVFEAWKEIVRSCPEHTKLCQSLVLDIWLRLGPSSHF